MSGRHVIAGIGCRRDCPAEDIAALVREAETVSGHAVTALAAPAAKIVQVQAAANLLGLNLLPIAAAALAEAQPRCPTRSVAAERTLGIASVAEGSALAAAGPGGRLLLARIASARATCALAQAAA